MRYSTNDVERCPELRGLAWFYAYHYVGDFEFMQGAQEVAETDVGFLHASSAFVKGVLNCWVAAPYDGALNSHLAVPPRRALAEIEVPEPPTRPEPEPEPPPAPADIVWHRKGHLWAEAVMPTGNGKIHRAWAEPGSLPELDITWSRNHRAKDRIAGRRPFQHILNATVHTVCDRSYQSGWIAGSREELMADPRNMNGLCTKGCWADVLGQPGIVGAYTQPEDDEDDAHATA